MTKKLIILILMTLTLSWQAEAARTVVSGFEVGNAKGEGNNAVAGTCAGVQSTTARTGTYAFRANTTATSCNLQFNYTASSGSLRALFLSVRFYLKIVTLPDALSQMYITGTGGNEILYLGTDGTLRAQNTVSVNTLSADGLWHQISYEWINSASRKVYVDGTLWITSTDAGGATSAGTSASFGSGSNLTQDLYFDDIVFDDGDANIGSGKVLLVKPTTDPGSLNSWTGGAGGTTNLWDAVNNIPPVGLAPASETNTSQIKNAASGGNLDYVATTQSYQTAGVGASDTVNAVMAIGNDCEEITTGTKAGGYWIGTNPAQTAGGTAFNFGDDTATVCGTFPTGWATHVGPVTTSGITIGSTATVAIRKTTSTTRVTDADFLGIYVDYTPFVAGAVKRLPLLGIGAWLLTQVTDIYNSLFGSSVAFAASSKNPHTTVDSDFLGIYVDYTPSGAIPTSPHFVPTPTVSVR